MDHREQEEPHSALSEWIDSQRKTYGLRKGIAERISRMVADLKVETKPISGVIADRLIFTHPPMFPRKVWGGARGLGSQRRMRRLFDLLDIAEGSIPPSEAFLLRFQVNGADWVPHPYNAPTWALSSLGQFASSILNDERAFALCKQWAKENDETVDLLVSARLNGLNVLCKSAFLCPGGIDYIDVAIWLNAADPRLFDVNTVWKHETELAILIKKVFPDAIREYSPPWLGSQRLDIYVPCRKLAFEYQGEQHYRPIEFFAGAKGYASRLEQDRRKKLLCATNGVTLIEWKYTTGISEENLLRHLASIGIRDTRLSVGQEG